MKKAIVLVVLLTAVATYGELFINEIDYDQISTDTQEYIELAGTTGTYTNIRIELINGNTSPGSMYLSVDIPSLTITNEHQGYGFYVIGSALVENVDLTPGGWPETNIIQNGAPDAVVLKVGGVIVDAVSYEGPMNDENGNAMEMATPAGVEAIDDGEGNSISIQRMGRKGSPWQVVVSTPGEINTDQTFEDVNYLPKANAGTDQIVNINTEVTLDGSASYDPDGEIINYLWTQLSGTSVTLNSGNTAIATFTSPSAATELEFQLLVTDDEGGTDTDTVMVSVVEVSASKIIISEYIEGSYGQNKYLEIANVGDISVDLNAEAYTLGQAKDGSGIITDIVMTNWGSFSNLAPGEVIVLAAVGHTFYANADTALEYPSVVHFNGNDAVGLLQNGIVVDLVGDPYSSEFILQDLGLRRNGDISTGNPVFTMSEWTQLPTDDVSGLGFHGGAGAPIVQNVSVSPDFLVSGFEITLSADIVPAEGQTIEAANIYYGAGGSQLNTAEMWLDQGNTWMGVVPAQSGNILFEYKIQTRDGDGNEFFSALYSQLVASSSSTAIADIQANADAWDNQIHTITGVVTIGVNVIQEGRTSAYMQDESGRGLNLFDYTEYADITRGQRLTVVGYVDKYYSTVEIKDFAYRIDAEDQALPAAATVTVAGANSSDWEGTLIQFGGEVSARYDLSTNNGSRFTIRDGSDTTTVMIWYTTGIDMSGLTIGSHAHFKGVGSQYSSFYQLLVGYQEDITPQTAIDERIAEKFRLSAAYPNPFNSSTTVSFTLPESRLVKTAIYNLQGQLVWNAESVYQAGSHPFIWNAAGQSSGVYFIRIDAGADAAIQKVLLLK